MESAPVLDLPSLANWDTSPELTTADAGPKERCSRSGRVVVLGGVPGSGKTTLIRRVQLDRPEVRAIDSDHMRELITRAVPAGVPYACYRPLVHTLNTVHILLVLLRGPVDGAPLIIHDPATRPLRRAWMVLLARRRGWRPALMMLDVARTDALDGQRRRGRVVRGRAFEAHWQRW